MVTRPGHVKARWRRGSQSARAGAYLHLGRLEVLRHQGGTLPGTGCYVRVPLAVAVVLVPLAGAAYVLALPFVGLALLAYTLTCKLALSLRTAGRALLALMAVPAWLPGRAYLLRRLPRHRKPTLSRSVEDELRGRRD